MPLLGPKHQLALTAAFSSFWQPEVCVRVHTYVCGVCACVVILGTAEGRTGVSGAGSVLQSARLTK